MYAKSQLSAEIFHFKIHQTIQIIITAAFKSK